MRYHKTRRIFLECHQNIVLRTKKYLPYDEKKKISSWITKSKITTFCKKNLFVKILQQTKVFLCASALICYAEPSSNTNISSIKINILYNLEKKSANPWNESRAKMREALIWRIFWLQSWCDCCSALQQQPSALLVGNKWRNYSMFSILIQYTRSAAGTRPGCRAG